MKNEAFYRISAVALKEWRLNLRFATEYFVNNFITPLKSAAVMIFLYTGLFKASESFMGTVTKENYMGYVLLGTLLHSQFTCSASLLSGKLIGEKYWQTALGTLLSPVHIFEIVVGYGIGSGGMTIVVNGITLAILAIFYPLPLSSFCLALLILFLVALLGYGLGLVGATIGLVWEGKMFLYHYFMQGLTFLSCFYYPIGFLPEFLRPIVQAMPTYQMGEILHNLYFGVPNTHLILPLTLMTFAIVAVMSFAGYLFNHATRKYGIVGY